MEYIKWIFFDVGSTLVDESKVYEERMKTVAETANVSYEYVYQTALKFYKETPLYKFFDKKCRMRYLGV